MVKNRVGFIDIAKGIGIILVVVLHCGYKLPQVGILNAPCIMPLFFILSGYFFRSHGNFKIYLKKKLNGLLFPFLFFGAIGVFIDIGAHIVFRTEVYTFEDFIVHRMMFNLPIWFLLALFWISIIYYFIDYYIKNSYIKFITVILLGVIGYLTQVVSFISFPFFLDSALVALPLYYLGIVFNKIEIKYKINSFSVRQSAYYNTILLFILCLIYTSILILNKNILFNIGMNTFNPTSYGMYIILSFIIIYLCKIIDKAKTLMYIGKNTISILCLHWIIMGVFYKLPLPLWGGVTR